MEKHNELFKCPSCAGLPALPTFVSANVPNFIWGSSLNGAEFCDRISAAYDQVVHWRNNLFMVPFGKAGTDFVTELSKVFQNYNSMECIALKAAMVMPPLLLQRPHQNSKSHDHVICLERRLSLWRDGNILHLLNEGCSIQHCLQTNKGERSNFEYIARKFAKLMSQGKVKAALRFVSDKSCGSFLPVSTQIREFTVLEELIKKHSSPSSVSSSSLIVSNSTL